MNKRIIKEMKMIQIKNRFTGKVIKEIDADSLQGVDLTGAYLKDANLKGANLKDADLTGANLTGSNLHEAYLKGAKGLEGLTIIEASEYYIQAYNGFIKIGCYCFKADEWLHEDKIDLAKQNNFNNDTINEYLKKIKTIIKGDTKK